MEFISNSVELFFNIELNASERETQAPKLVDLPPQISASVQNFRPVLLCVYKLSRVEWSL